LTDSPRRGDVWMTDTGITGFGVDLGDNSWAAPGMVTALRKARLGEFRRRIEVQVLTDVNNMLFKIFATPDR